ncbi:MAG: 1-deoxy-D-xylulose-5-phosphate reductoisomerase [Clostridia bacterium]|nr:1-deoxy-D-xylulose-5-phosphate reductoisomerase [Clostridia bacterium]
MKKIALIGSTGSIGRQLIEIVKRHSDKFKIVALVANNESEQFEMQKKALAPEISALASKDREKALACAQIPDADIIFNAAGGFAGLAYSLKAVQAGKTLALANKETLVCGGDLIMPLAEKTGAKILPVDSEHSAIWQCLNFDSHAPLKRLIITASGGAFRNLPPEKLESVTPEQALNHPTWKMGKKITVDSATLMNKGYEVIEAHVLYGTDYDRIETVIQPTSIVHSLVELADGAVLAQMSYPTMELPISLALTYPERMQTTLKPMDFKSAFSLEFQPMIRENYPCFDIALKCGEAGGIMPCVLNAADETAVYAFLNKQIAFTDIYRVVAQTVAAFSNEKVTSFEQLEDINDRASDTARKIIKRLQ